MSAQVIFVADETNSVDADGTNSVDADGIHDMTFRVDSFDFVS